MLLSGIDIDLFKPHNSTRAALTSAATQLLAGSLSVHLQNFISQLGQLQTMPILFCLFDASLC